MEERIILTQEMSFARTSNSSSKREATMSNS